MDKVKFKDDGELLKKLSFIFNIIILSIELAGIVALSLYMRHQYYKWTDTGDSTPYNGMGSAILVFVYVFMWMGLIILCVFLIFSFITILMGYKNKHKAYSVMSLIQAIVLAYLAFTFSIGCISYFEAGDFTNAEVIITTTSIFSAAIYSIVNIIIQIFYMKYLKQSKQDNVSTIMKIM